MTLDDLYLQDMNEVASFDQGSNKGCEVNNLNNPPFTPSMCPPTIHSVSCGVEVAYSLPFVNQMGNFSIYPLKS